MRYLLSLFLLTACGHSVADHPRTYVYTEIPVDEIPDNPVEEKVDGTIICYGWNTGKVIYGPVKAEIVSTQGQYSYLILKDGRGVRVCGNCDIF